MSRTTKNRQFILDYYRTISGTEKTEVLMKLFTTDTKLIHHVLFFEKLFPKYEIFTDEITTEGDRVIIQGRKRGRHIGKLKGLSPTNKLIEIPFAIGYRIENEKIIDHWFITGQMELLEQLGLVKMLKQ
jgi:hypothetical protein